MCDIKLRNSVSKWPVVGRFGYVSKRYKSFSNFTGNTLCFNHTGQTDRKVNYDDCESHQKHMNVLKVKFSRYRAGVAQRVCRGITLLFHDRGTTRGWVVSSTSRPQFTPGKDPVPILQETGWAPGPVWMGGISRPHRDFYLCPYNFIYTVMSTASVV